MRGNRPTLTQYFSLALEQRKFLPCNAVLPNRLSTEGTKRHRYSTVTPADIQTRACGELALLLPWLPLGPRCTRDVTLRLLVMLATLRTSLSALCERFALPNRQTHIRHALAAQLPDPARPPQGLRHRQANARTTSRDRAWRLMLIGLALLVRQLGVILDNAMARRTGQRWPPETMLERLRQRLADHLTRDLHDHDQLVIPKQYAQFLKGNAN